MTRRQRRGTAGYGGEGTSAVRADQPPTVDDLADRPALSPRTGDRDELRQRLWRLPPGHPSSPAEAEARPAEGESRPAEAEAKPAEREAKPAEAERTPAEPERAPEPREHAPDRGPPTKDAADSRPLTDAEHAEHVAKVRELLDKARAAGLSTDRQHTIDPARQVWADERDALHDSIILDLYARASDVPCQRRAILAGGLPGAGKSTVLEHHAGIDRSRYLTINPDDVKEEMARRDMIPHVNGLSPMETSDLVHEESSHVAKRLARHAQSDGKNVIWDITMSSPESTERRIGELRSYGYTSIEAIFVDIPVETSVTRADGRHREGQDRYRAGEGVGGRLTPAEMIRAQADPEWGSHNRKTFEQVKNHFDRWCLFDNSGSTPVLTEAGRREEDHDHY